MIKKRNPWVYILLNTVTLGIYGLFFWSEWTKDVNKVCEGDGNESAHYILVFTLDILTAFIYAFCWNYKMVERMYQKARDYDVSLKHGGIYVMLWRALPFVSSVYKIKYLNQLAGAYNRTVAAFSEDAEEN